MNGGMGFSEFTLVLDTAVAGIPGISRPLIVPAGSSGFTLADQLVSRAQLQSGNDAIATGSQSWTYGELLCAAVDIAVSIQTSPRFQPGARIVLRANLRVDGGDCGHCSLQRTSFADGVKGFDQTTCIAERMRHDRSRAIVQSWRDRAGFSDDLLHFGFHG